MTFTPCFRRGNKAVGHRINVCIDARAHILEINDEHVDAVEHCLGGLARFAVQGIHGHAAEIVGAVRRFDHVFLDVRAEALLRSEDCAKPHARVRGQPIGDVNQAVIDRRRVADDADALAVERCGGEKPFRPELDLHGRDYFIFSTK